MKLLKSSFFLRNYVLTTLQAHIELVTAWVLGRGPCGPGCSKLDVGRSTANSRSSVIATAGIPTYLGNFSVDFPSLDSDDVEKDAEKNSVTLERILNTELNNNYTEVVLAVNEHALWEQEILRFSFDLEKHKSHQDFK